MLSRETRDHLHPYDDGDDWWIIDDDDDDDDAGLEKNLGFLEKKISFLDLLGFLKFF